MSKHFTIVLLFSTTFTNLGYAFYYHMSDTETFSNHHYAKCWLNDHRAMKVEEFITVGSEQLVDYNTPQFCEANFNILHACV